MKRWLKAFGALLCLLVLLAASSLFLPDRAYKSMAIGITQLVTDRDLHIGSLTVHRGVQTNIELSDISFSNADWSDRQFMVQADELMASINLRALLGGVFEISRFSSSGLKVNLEKNAQGHHNWQKKQCVQARSLTCQVV